MNRHPARPRTAIVVVVILATLGLFSSPLATMGHMAVIDAANIVQTTISAVKAVESVINEVQMIANQVKQIENLIQDTQNLGRGGYRSVTEWSREYDSWTRTTLDALRGVLSSVRLHAEDFASEQARIQVLQGLSDSAEGRMQALQLGNMMAGEKLQQLVKLRRLMMAQINAQNVYMANQTNREAQRAATQSEWIRNGNADAPQLTGAAGGGAPRP